jgi:hypothetical protein
MADAGLCRPLFAPAHAYRSGLYRCKGVLWVADRRSHRFILHLSGRRRIECTQEGVWEGPPQTQVVFIGADKGALQRLRDAFHHAVSAGEAAAGQGASCSRADAVLLAGHIAAHERLLLLSPWAAAAPAAGGGAGGEVVLAAAGAPAPAGHTDNEQLSFSPTHTAAAPAATSPHTGAMQQPQPQDAGGGTFLEFSLAGSRLHGIVAEELNAEAMRQWAKAGGGELLVGVVEAGAVSAVTGLAGRRRWVGRPCDGRLH